MRIVSIDNLYNQSLKRNIGRVPVSVNNYSQLIGRVTKPTYTPSLHVKFNADDIDGIQLSAGLQRNNFDFISIASATFNIYSVSLDGWVKTFLVTKSGASNGSEFIADATGIEIPELGGDTTLYVECSMTRLNKTYKIAKYFNHLGIYDSFFRLKKEVQFIRLTKEDL